MTNLGALAQYLIHGSTTRAPHLLAAFDPDTLMDLRRTLQEMIGIQTKAEDQKDVQRAFDKVEQHMTSRRLRPGKALRHVVVQGDEDGPWEYMGHDGMFRPMRIGHDIRWFATPEAAEEVAAKREGSRVEPLEINVDEEYPQHFKVQHARHKSQSQGEFIDWLRDSGRVICTWDGEEEEFHAVHNAKDLLYEMHDVDKAELQREKDRMLGIQRQLKSLSDA